MLLVICPDGGFVVNIFLFHCVNDFRFNFDDRFYASV
jgi:hypothetical protein